MDNRQILIALLKKDRYENIPVPVLVALKLSISID